MTFTPSVPTLKPAFDVVVELGDLQDHVSTRGDHRRVIPILGGTITGEINADVLAGGADWQRMRPDGAMTSTVETLHAPLRTNTSTCRSAVSALALPTSWNPCCVGSIFSPSATTSAPWSISKHLPRNWRNGSERW